MIYSLQEMFVLIQKYGQCKIIYSAIVVMTWKTRNIRKRHKGKKSKKNHRGGLSFTKPSASLSEVVNYLVTNPQDIAATIDKELKTIRFAPNNKFMLDQIEYRYTIEVNKLRSDKIIIVKTKESDTKGISGKEINIEGLTSLKDTVTNLKTDTINKKK